MTVSKHTALYKFTFPSQSTIPATPSGPLILAELTDLPISRSNGSVFVQPDSGRIVGSGTFNPSFGQGHYDLHFCTDFQGAKILDTGIFNSTPSNQTKSITISPDGDGFQTSLTTPVGAWVQFARPFQDDQILARVGVSFFSGSQACSNAESDINDFNFNRTKEAAEESWRMKLDVVHVRPGGVGQDFETIFWSGLYRSMISPQDYTGENPLWKSDEPYYDSFYCIWDSFRSIHPLITLLDPQFQSRMVRSLVDTYVHEGYLPDCRMSLSKGWTQGGSNADVVLVDSYLKNVTDVDWLLAYKAMVKDAQQEPQNWNVEGRGGMASWKSLHFIPIHDNDTLGTGLFTRSISRTVEVSNDSMDLITGKLPPLTSSNHTHIPLSLLSLQPIKFLSTTVFTLRILLY